MAIHIYIYTHTQSDKAHFYWSVNFHSLAIEYPEVNNFPFRRVWQISTKWRNSSTFLNKQFPTAFRGYSHYWGILFLGLKYDGNKSLHLNLSIFDVISSKMKNQYNSFLHSAEVMWQNYSLLSLQFFFFLICERRANPTSCMFTETTFTTL